MVRTTVGLRCPDCAGTRHTSSIRTPTDSLVKSIGGGLAVALVVAVLWRFIPDWGFYLSLAMGFGVVEMIAKLTNNKRGPDLQMLAIAIITLGFLLSRALLAQRFGVTLADINNLAGAIWTEPVRDIYGSPQSVDFLLRLRLVPDVIYALLAYAIAWIRFR